MNTEAKPTVRKDALVATLVIAALGLLWLVFRLYWQGLLLLLSAGLVAYLGYWRARATADAPTAKPKAEPKAELKASSPQKRGRADGPGRGKKKRRRK